MPITRRLFLALGALALVAGACGDAGSEPAPVVTDAPVATTGAPATDAGGVAPATDEPASAGSLASTIDGPEAPNFALTLGETTDQFVLGEVNQPVYLVFWADW